MLNTKQQEFVDYAVKSLVQTNSVAELKEQNILVTSMLLNAWLRMLTKVGKCLYLSYYESVSTTSKSSANLKKFWLLNTETETKSSCLCSISLTATLFLKRILCSYHLVIIQMLSLL